MLTSKRPALKSLKGRLQKQYYLKYIQYENTVCFISDLQFIHLGLEEIYYIGF